MATITAQEIQELSQPQGGLCVSIFLPTVKAGDQVQQNTIRYKNLLQEAEKQLSDRGLDPLQIQKLMGAANDLRQDDVFWQQQEHGLGVFIGESGLHTMKLPAPVEEKVVVNHRFYLKPLVQFLHEGGDFYILALSQNQIRLLRGSPYEVQDVNLEGEDIPKNLSDALRFDEFQENIQWHTGTVNPRGNVQSGGVSGGSRPAMFHGHGEGEDDKKDHLLEYFQKIDKGLNEMLKDQRPPLVLASVEYLQPIYKQANTYDQLIDAGIKGNPENIRPEELHKEAWKLVEPMYQTTRVETSERYNMLKGREDALATDDLKRVIEAAPYGRVETLFIDKNASVWGKFDADAVQLTLADGPGGENEDLVDYAALQTIANGGAVYMVEPHEVPGGGQVAAILRY